MGLFHGLLINTVIYKMKEYSLLSVKSIYVAENLRLLEQFSVLDVDFIMSLIV